MFERFQGDSRFEGANEIASGTTNFTGNGSSDDEAPFETGVVPVEYGKLADDYRNW